jgi:hypothetical protein
MVFMDLNYVISARTNGANPFKIFEYLEHINEHHLEFALRKLAYQNFLNTAYWFAVSHTAKARAGMRCQVCNSPQSITTHHRTYDTHGREHLNMNDLVVLCENCHGLFHGHLPAQFVPKMTKGEVAEPQLRTKGPITIPHDPTKDSEMPPGETIMLTRELINNCRANGSFTNATLKALGLTWAMMKSGWAHRLQGQTISRDQYRQALEGRFIYRDKLPRN